MIVWLASYPRSGNTLLRIALHQLYGLHSCVVYDFDGVALRLGDEFVGHRLRRQSLDDLRASPHAHLVKTHRAVGDDVRPEDAAICLVRDGRDAVVSWARQTTEVAPERYATVAMDMVGQPERRGAGSWGTNVVSWLDAPGLCRRVLMRYEDLIADTAGTVDAAIAALGLAADRKPHGCVPSFEQLHAKDPLFFRRGQTGTWMEELPEQVLAAFLARPDNTDGLQMLNAVRAANASSALPLQRLSGRVSTGKGDLAQWMRRYAPAYERAAGTQLYPGSLNIRLAKPWNLPTARLRLAADKVGVNVNLVPCRLLGRNAWIFRTDNDEADGDAQRTVELLSAARLRTAYSLTDGDEIGVTVIG